MGYEHYQLLKTTVEQGVATVIIDNPPINLLDMPMIEELIQLGHDLEADDDVRVIIFESADPDFFIAHVDINLIQQQPHASTERPTTLSFFHEMLEKFRTMPKVTIGKVEGRARGGGSELLLALDMRFAAIGTAVFSQPEVAVGIIPGGGGSARLPRLIGRGRALEVILGCEDFSAQVAERYGYINRALPAEELSPFVGRLAHRIASFPVEAVALAKAAVDGADGMTTVEALLEEEHCLNRALATQSAQDGMASFLQMGGQTRAVELELDGLIDKVSSNPED
jgi:enoyl-CoA hydratase/carnithine racemase